MHQQKKFTKIIQAGAISFILVVLVTTLSIDVIRSNQHFTQTSEKICKEYLDSQKTLIKQEVDHVLDLVKYKKTHINNLLQETLRQRVYDANAIAQNIYEQNKTSYGREDIQKMILTALQPIRFAGGQGRYFIVSLESQQFLLKDDSENACASLKETFKGSSEGFYDCSERGGGESGKKHNAPNGDGKTVFVKQFAPYNWMIGAGLYFKDIEKLIQKDLLETIGHIRFGANRDGYIFVVSYDGITLMNGTQRHLVGKNLWNLTDPDGLKVIQEERKLVANPEGGFFQYVWNKPSSSKPSPKISFIHGVDDWQWMIGAGIYLDDIEEEISLIQSELYEQTRNKIFTFLLITLVLLSFFLLLFNWFNRKLKDDSRLILSFFKQAASSNNPIKLDLIYFSEIYQMALYANKMLEDKITAQDILLHEKEFALVSKNRLDDAQKIARIGSWDWELDTDRVLWSDELYRICGCDRTAFVPSHKAYLQLIHPDDKASFLELRKGVIQGREPYMVNYRIVRPNGEEVYVIERGKVVLDANDTPIEIVGTVQDISEFKKSEEDRIRLATAIDHASESIVITDIHGLIQYTNPAFESLTGYSGEEVLGKNPSVLSSGLHDCEFYKKMWGRLLSGKVWRGHLTNRKKDGTLFEENVSISPVMNDQGEICNYVAVKHDVSKEIFLEKQLRQAVKMEAIGTLAGGIAHDFNNILTAILGYGEMANSQLLTGSTLKGDIEQIIKAGNRAKELVQQILRFSRRGEEKFTPQKIQDICREALKLLRSSLPATIKFKENIDPDCQQVLADGTQIHQVLMNLCTNAKHAMEDTGGTLTMELSEVEVTGTAGITDCPQLKNGTYLELVIGDTGCGMSHATQLNIFDPFFTTKEIGKGTGLGLAVVHGIIRQHQGEITVSSQSGKGTVFHIYLPVTKSSPQIIPESSTLIADRGNERILLVDDEPAIVDMMQRMLSSLGYTVTSFYNSTEALAAFCSTPDAFDLLVTDMSMPDMTGAVLAARVLENRPGFPVVMCTGFSDTMDQEQAKSLGVRQYILKPVLKNQLAEAVRKGLDDHG